VKGPIQSLHDVFNQPEHDDTRMTPITRSFECTAVFEIGGDAGGRLVQHSILTFMPGRWRGVGSCASHRPRCIAAAVSVPAPGRRVLPRFDGQSPQPCQRVPAMNELSLRRLCCMRQGPGDRVTVSPYGKIAGKSALAHANARDHTAASAYGRAPDAAEPSKRRGGRSQLDPSLPWASCFCCDAQHRAHAMIW